jgi:hypothetical protein
MAVAAVSATGGWDLAYATTGHRAQGLTRGRALVRLTGSEEVNRLYVQLSRARQDTRLYAVVGPEPQDAGELDLPDRDQPDGYVQLAQAELRAERDRLRRQLDQPLAHPQARPGQRPPPAGRGRPGRPPAGHWPPAARHASLPAPWRSAFPGAGWLAVATQQANPAHDRERELRQHQQRRQGWLEANGPLGSQYRQVMRTLAWQRRATGLAVEADRPSYVLEALGPVPESTRGRRASRHAAAQIEHYRRSYHITDPGWALGAEPNDLTQRADRQRARTAIEWLQAKQRAADRSRDTQPTSERTSQPRPGEPRGRLGPERAAG